MKLVILKNGDKFKIYDEEAKILHDRITKGYQEMQCFQNEAEETTLIINLSELAAIIPLSHIV